MEKSAWLNKNKNMDDAKQKKIIDALNLIEGAKVSLQEAIDLLSDVAGKEEVKSLLSKAKNKGSVADFHEEKVIEGVFDGENMIGPDGKQYAVPPNYASKSKLVEGDLLKLTIDKYGNFTYKQIGPIERARLKGTLIKDESTDTWKVLAEGRAYNVLLASVTYFKGEPGDEAIILVPKDKASKWAAVEHIIKQVSLPDTSSPALGATHTQNSGGLFADEEKSEQESSDSATNVTENEVQESSNTQDQPSQTTDHKKSIFDDFSLGGSDDLDDLTSSPAKDTSGILEDASSVQSDTSSNSSSKNQYQEEQTMPESTQVSEPQFTAEETKNSEDNFSNPVNQEDVKPFSDIPQEQAATGFDVDTGQITSDTGAGDEVGSRQAAVSEQKDDDLFAPFQEEQASNKTSGMGDGLDALVGQGGDEISQGPQAEDQQKKEQQDQFSQNNDEFERI